MGFEERSRENAVFHAERQVLRALCQGTPQGSVREVAAAALKGYRWQEPVHAVLFEILAMRAALSPDALRSQLPALLTRRGFPDIDLDGFFVPHGLTKDEAENLINLLAEQSKIQ